MKTKSKKRVKNLNEVFYGNEPVFVPKLEPHSNVEIITALSYYNVILSQDDAKNELIKFAQKYYPKEIVKQIDKLKWVCNLGALCRMHERGCVFQNETVIHDKLMKLLETIPTAKNDDNIEKIIAPKPPKQNTVQKDVYYANILLDYIEEQCVSRRTYIKPSNLKKFLDNNKVPENLYKKISNIIQISSKEIHDVFFKLDESLVEGYSNYSKKELRQYWELCEYFINELVQLSNNGIKKARKKKPVDLNKKLANVKYLKQYDELNLKSIEPKNILDKKWVILYNVRYKTLTILVGAKMDIKGTTIYGYDVEKSVRKVLRKPEEILEKVLTIKTIDGKIKLLKELKTKESVPLGSLNENVIILETL